MKFEIRNLDGIRSLNYNEGNNEIYFLKTSPDGKKEKFKIADVVYEDNKLIYRFIENSKTSLFLYDLKKKLKIWKFLEHRNLEVEKETINIAVENEDGRFVEEFKNKGKQSKTPYSNEKIKNIIKLKTLSAFSV